MTRGTHNQWLGSYGETIALAHLRKAGMVLLDRNWRCRVGELDLVMRDSGVLVFCEVKTRRDASRGHPLEAIDETKAGRLHELAAHWQEANGVRPAEVRLDAVGVLLPKYGPATVEHVRGIG